MRNKKYVDKELVKLAKEQDVLDILLRDGIPLMLKNNVYRHKEHDSLVITPGRGFFWFSRDLGSRSPIDYYMLVENMDFITATYKVLEVMNYNFDKKNVVATSASSQRDSNFIPGNFSIPEKASHNKNVYSYLVKTRKIDSNIINDLIKKGVLYQSEKYANCVFLGKDYEGNIVSAFKRSTRTEIKDGDWVRSDEEGSQKEFRMRIENETNQTVNVFESEIDMLSYLTMQPELARNENYIPLGGVSSKGLHEFLKHKEINHINICTDNDEKGKKFCNRISEELGREYYITRELPITKDFNQDLVEQKIYKRNRIEVVTFGDETKELSKKEKLKVVNERFSKEYQGKKIDFTYPDIDYFREIKSGANINKHTREHFKKKDRIETNSAYLTRLNIGVEKDIPNFLRNLEYHSSKDEKKPEQNSTHHNTKKWHYFNKPIIVDGDRYTVLLDIREDFNHNTFIHKIRLEEITEKIEYEKNGKSSQISQNEDLRCEQLPSTNNYNIKENAKSQALKKDEEPGFCRITIHVLHLQQKIKCEESKPVLC